MERDADALFEKWGHSGFFGTTRPPEDTAYELREGSPDPAAGHDDIDRRAWLPPRCIG
jgi:hypothetical protein